MPDDLSLPVILTLVASLSGMGLLIASFFVRPRWSGRSVSCFGLGLLLMHSGNFARAWLSGVENAAEWQARLATFTPADRATPEGQEMVRWITERIERPPVDWLDWTLLVLGGLFGVVALANPVWVKWLADRRKSALGPAAPSGDAP